MSVTLRYDGTKSPSHLRERLTVKSITLEHGKDLVLSDADAGMVVASAPKGSVTIVSGTPAAYKPMPASVRAATKQVQAQVGNPDLGARLAGLPSLPAEGARALLTGKEDELLKDIAAGKLDEHADAAALLCHLGGRPALALALVERAKKKG